LVLVPYTPYTTFKTVDCIGTELHDKLKRDNIDIEFYNLLKPIKYTTIIFSLLVTYKKGVKLG
jgi:hypothetical protein